MSDTRRNEDHDQSMRSRRSSNQNDNRALRILTEGTPDVGCELFPFFTSISGGESFSVSDGQLTSQIQVVCYQGEVNGGAPSMDEAETFRNFLQFFRGINAKNRYNILCINEPDILTLLTFYEVDSKYAVSIIHRRETLAILVKLKSFFLPDTAKLLVDRFRLNIRMRGSYFWKDETNMSAQRKESRMATLCHGY